jgi:hypothetical protein
VDSHGQQTKCLRTTAGREQHMPLYSTLKPKTFSGTPPKPPQLQLHPVSIITSISHSKASIIYSRGRHNEIFWKINCFWHYYSTTQQTNPQHTELTEMPYHEDVDRGSLAGARRVGGKPGESKMQRLVTEEWERESSPRRLPERRCSAEGFMAE